MKTRMINWMMPAILVGLMVALSACADAEALAGKGREAAIEFCDCYRKNSKEACFDKLKSKYATYEYESDEFIKAFNDTNTCGAKLFLEYAKY